MKKKKIIIGIFIAVAILLIVGIIVGVVIFNNVFNSGVELYDRLAFVESTSDQEVLDYFANESNFVYDMSEFDKEYEEAVERNTDIDNESEEWIKTAVDVPEDYQKFYSGLNQNIIDFFNEKYGVSVADKIAIYEVKQMDIPSKYDAIGGGYYYDNNGDGNVSYFNSNKYEIPLASLDEVEVKELADLYIHETIHYLGFYNPKEFRTDIIMEGFTQALTIDVLDYIGYEKIDLLETYELNVRLARQIMIVNNDIVKTILMSNKNGDVLLFDELKSVLGEEKATDLCNMHITIESLYFEPNFTGDIEMLNIAQYLTAEYCRSFKPTDEQILEMHKYFIAPVSEI